MPNETCDYGDLKVTLTSDLQWMWNEKDTGGDLYGEATLLVGNASKGSEKPAVASPTGYTKIWTGRGSGGKYDGSFWRPIAPSRYVALGYICISNNNTPSVNYMYTEEIEKIAVLDDLYRANSNYEMPPVGLARILGLPCPKDFNEFRAKIPQFTKDNLLIASQMFSELPQCEVILTFTAFFAVTDRANLGVSISASVGIKAIGGGVDVSLNYQFTSKTSSSYGEYSEYTHEQRYTIAPRTATILLSERVWMQATRSDDSVSLREISFTSTDNTNRVEASFE
ncbi:hypothetical protein COCSADRAFT_173037 [Bipolaris sorokiniana ND90Pr]|uniref:Uncharacterized protein n=1 Tax=Cochliobolus sativus (strain ND90Pr / ATCC 201652) TaxID=665912 RepID=M2T097_COCSN|nr:uncharacterized protein COCSADRAFT_173037 [Bipolaris sorokiniana ND90Pr]EMD62596.1 hypothetical protein COCSADRAFT_173037 [Bipolaris sorokiniana ND90Pr]